MTYVSQISGLNDKSLSHVLEEELSREKILSVGVASAFVSVAGMRDMLAITASRRLADCRLIAGTNNCITHPQALRDAMDAGWRVKIGHARGNAIFHPKMIVSGRKFNGDGEIVAPEFVYIGSSNLTRGGLQNNVECGVIARADSATPSLSSCFAALWGSGEAVTEKLLRDYAAQFARVNRSRRIADIEALGISDGENDIPNDSVEFPRRRKAAEVAMSPEVAAAAWAGLESFTGEYRFQVEFPQAAGHVVRGIIGGASDRDVPVICSDDGIVRQMSYRFYADNGMFRLNIPNDVPGVTQARRDRRGIALIEQPARRGVAATLTILNSGPKLKEVIGRSYLLGTWGSTPTRAYGWY